MENLIDSFKFHGGATPVFSLNNLRTYARVVDVYDGDTLHAVIPTFGSFFKFSIRLYGIDACEMKSHNAANKELAIRARNRVIELITNKDFSMLKNKKEVDMIFEKDVYLVWLHCLEMDKYGRVLAKIYASEQAERESGLSFSEILLAEKLAYPYFGETKKSEVEQLGSLSASYIP
jgi:endonuclease YncB( thermonuclease family)